MDWDDDQLREIGQPDNKARAHHENAGWVKVCAVVDSGAADSVMPLGMLSHIPVQAIAKPKAGIGLRGAGGEIIENAGQK